MQKTTFFKYYFKSFLTDIYNPCRLRITHYFTSLVSRFCVHGTFQINQSNFLIFNPAFIRVSRNHIVHACPCPTAGGDRQERYYH
jgi:hypothetical protein